MYGPSGHREHEPVMYTHSLPPLTEGLRFLNHLPVDSAENRAAIDRLTSMEAGPSCVALLIAEGPPENSQQLLTGIIWGIGCRIVPNSLGMCVDF